MRKSSKKFWNNELESLWQDKKNADRLLRKCNKIDSYAKRRHFKAACGAFDKKLRFYERQFNRNKMLYLEELHFRNPTQFWNEVNKLGPTRYKHIPIEVYDSENNIMCNLDFLLSKWKSKFMKLYNVNNSLMGGEFINYAKQMNYTYEQDMLDPLYDVKCGMDHAFSLKEITDVVNKVKLGKSDGADGIPNEILKNKRLISTLHGLFNLFYDYAIVPSTWSDAIICPIK